ncbi:hypothetical protein K490DRAFT_62024 [Saccharata proteae CBS 121410]|uniref:HypA-like protein n=1 Tax=Saccharata proteae CBS 121410 TaxID=1314787 RepID=A0A9P4LXL2_9PEZI|nr:hypothetical protein K490DRAFT_62024 [Saccharata proteae CBS 121410]
MATARTVKLSPSDPPEVYYRLGEDSAARASVLLQENHDKHHIFFNSAGFHNHIAHHLPTLWAIGATPIDIQKQYDANKHYQRPPMPVKESDVKNMHDPSKWKSYLGQEKYYNDFLVYFQDEIDQKGWQNVLNEYVFAGDERADDMLVRLFASFLHPIIHLGFGVEFKQPAIIAEALAQTAIHDDWEKDFLLGAEKAAKAKTTPPKTLVELIDAIRKDEKIAKAAHWNDDSKLRDGVFAREPRGITELTADFRVSPDELEFKTAEIANAAAYFTGAAQNPEKAIKFDFFYIHCVNCNVFLSAFIKQTWLSAENKVRLLEWKGRNDLAMYASRAAPELHLNEITHYKPKMPSTGHMDDWQNIYARVAVHQEDGHAAKLIRALSHGQKVCKPYENRKEFRIKHDMWLKLGHMAIDSVEAGDPAWVRGAGFPEAWAVVTDRESRL